MKIYFVIVLLVLLAALPATGQGTFVMLSFNTLHYGWGTNTANKDQAIFVAQQSVKADAIVLQEFMANADYGGLAALFPTGSKTFVASQTFFGKGSYREGYLTILDNTKFTYLAWEDFDHLAAPGGPFSRPPLVARVQAAGSANDYYIGNFHAIWGRSQAQRRNEAAAICNDFLMDLGTPNLALGGDWNLTAAQVTANAPCIAVATPNGLTTLNRGGSAYSSSYDHAVVLNGAALTITNAGILQPADTQNWRLTVSDHVPIYVTYAYQ